MRHHTLRTLAFVLCSAIFCFAQTSAVPPRINKAVDASTVKLKGNVHPLALPQYDQGALPDSQPLDRMLLLLRRSDDQEKALQQLLNEQQTKGSPNYHAWLTPQEFAQRFGPADADIKAVTDWLASQGFYGIHVSQGKLVIEFTGNAGQVRSAFHTPIHKFMVNGKLRHANVNDPQIPAALAPVVAGVVSLHNFPLKSQAKPLGTFRRDKTTGLITPLFTFAPNPNQPNLVLLGVGPADLANIYNVIGLWQVTMNGIGQTIAVVGDSNINLQDVHDFRTMFGLPTGAPANTPQVIVNGPDPGLNDDEVEAALDVQWAGALAYNAQVILVVSESPASVGASGPDLSALYIIDNNLAPVMSESFGGCEAVLTVAGNQFEAALWQQASAQGISAMVSSGDNGSAGCDNPNLELVATQGLAVSGTASTPYNTAVGGTDFNSKLANYVATYWSPDNTPGNQSSARSYIPELTWNDTCAAGGSVSGCTAPVINNDAMQFPGIDLVAGSGGVSSLYSKPSWQTGSGVPSDGKRDLPDVSFFSGIGTNGSFYIFCQRDANANQGGNPSSCDLNAPYLDFQGAGGTSFAAPVFASMIALVNQHESQQGRSGRQGNVNYTLYSMAAQPNATCTSAAAAVSNPNCIFYDIPAGAGNISVACQGGSPGCSNTNAQQGQYGIMTSGGVPAYNATAGYDLATGLGSVNAYNLVFHWSAANFRATNTAFILNNGAPVATTHGAPIPVSGTVSPQSGGGTPSGIVELIQGSTYPGPVIDTFTLTNGSYGGSTSMLPGSNGPGYSVFAHYGGDGTFAASDSGTQAVSTVSKENSAVAVSFVTFTNAGVPVLSTAPAPVAYGSPYVLRADVTNAAKLACAGNPVPCPTGSVSFFDNGSALNDFLVPGTTTLTNVAQLTNLGFLEDQPVQLPVGVHNITANYAGDTSYNPQPSSNVLAVTISKGVTQLATPTGPNSVMTGTNFNLSATLSTQSSGVAPTGALTFLDGNTALTGTLTTTPTDGSSSGPAMLKVTLNTMLSTAGAHNITATYAGDANYVAAGPTAALAITASSVTVVASTVNVSRGGPAQNASVTLTPAPGFSGQVTVNCTIPAGMNEASCTPASQNANISANQQTFVTVSISAAAPHAVALHRGSRWATLGFVLLGGLALAVPVWRRRAVVLIALLALAILGAGFFGCGGGAGGGAAQDPGTPKGVYAVPITATQNGITVGSGTATVTVQ